MGRYICNQKNDDIFKSSIIVSKGKSNQDIFIYPNPVKDEISIQIKKDGIDNIILYSSFGEEVKTHSLNGENQIINMDVSKLSSGLYFCSFYSKGKLISNKKVIIIQ